MILPCSRGLRGDSDCLRISISVLISPPASAFPALSLSFLLLIGELSLFPSLSLLFSRQQMRESDADDLY